MKEVLLRQDETDYYCKKFYVEFREFFGISFEMLLCQATRVPTDEDEIKYTCNDLLLYQSAYHPYWTVYKLSA